MATMVICPLSLRYRNAKIQALQPFGGGNKLESFSRAIGYRVTKKNVQKACSHFSGQVPSEFWSVPLRVSGWSFTQPPKEPAVQSEVQTDSCTSVTDNSFRFQALTAGVV